MGTLLSALPLCGFIHFILFVNLGDPVKSSLKIFHFHRSSISIVLWVSKVITFKIKRKKYWLSYLERHTVWIPKNCVGQTGDCTDTLVFFPPSWYTLRIIFTCRVLSHGWPSVKMMGSDKNKRGCGITYTSWSSNCCPSFSPIEENTLMKMYFKTTIIKPWGSTVGTWKLAKELK